MFESALIVGICGPPWKQLLQNFQAFIDRFKNRPYYIIFLEDWTLTEYLSSYWEAIWYLQELSLPVVSRYQITFNVAVQVWSKNVHIAESLALAFRSQFWDIFYLFIKAIVLLLIFSWRYRFQWKAPVESCVSPTGYKLGWNIFLRHFCRLKLYSSNSQVQTLT